VPPVVTSHSTGKRFLGSSASSSPVPPTAAAAAAAREKRPRPPKHTGPGPDLDVLLDALEEMEGEEARRSGQIEADAAGAGRRRVTGARDELDVQVPSPPYYPYLSSLYLSFLASSELDVQVPSPAAAPTNTPCEPVAVASFLRARPPFLTLFVSLIPALPWRRLTCSRTCVCTTGRWGHSSSPARPAPSSTPPWPTPPTPPRQRRQPRAGGTPGGRGRRPWTVWTRRSRRPQ